MNEMYNFSKCPVTKIKTFKTVKLYGTVGFGGRVSLLLTKDSKKTDV